MEFFFKIFLLDSDGFVIEKEDYCVEANNVDSVYSLADEYAEEELLSYEYESGIPDSYESRLIDVLG